MSELRFEEEKHRYYVGRKRIPSVNQVLKSVGLVDFSKVPKHILKRAADRGTAVHEATEMYDKGGDPEIQDEHLGYFDAWLNFSDEWIEEHLAVEKMGWTDFTFSENSFKFAGTIDRVSKLKEKDGLAVIDIKTSKYVYYSYRMSMPMYAEIAGELFPDEEIKYLWLVYLAPNGKYHIEKISPNIPMMINMFMLELKKKKKRKVVYDG